MATEPPTMWALTFDRTREAWDTSTGMVKERVPVPTLGPLDAEHVLLRVHYAGFCGSDRGIWSRRAFGDLILGSLDRDGADRRIFGHEVYGVVEAVGADVTARYGIVAGDTVAAESHVTCGECATCRAGKSHVCLQERILGISTDGVFAEVAKLPAKILWKTDTARIRPEVAAVQEPFGNAVHACSVAPMRDQRVVIIGTGTIGLFAVLVARGLGAAQVIGVEPNAEHAARARALGCDAVLTPRTDTGDRADTDLVAQIRDLTGGLGADVVLEMSGVPASTNTALQAVHPGGDVVLFGIRNGDLTIQDAHRLVMRGLTVHGVVGRRLWDTWETTRALLEDPSTGVQQAVWEHVLDGGQGTIVDIADWEPAAFEAIIRDKPKAVIRFA